MARPRLSDPGIAVRVRIRESDLEVLKQAAKESDKTLSDLYREILQEFLKDYRDKNNISKDHIL